MAGACRISVRLLQRIISSSFFRFKCVPPLKASMNPSVCLSSFIPMSSSQEIILWKLSLLVKYLTTTIKILLFLRINSIDFFASFFQNSVFEIFAASISQVFPKALIDTIYFRYIFCSYNLVFYYIFPHFFLIVYCTWSH